MATNTPWGYSQQSYKFGRGITQYSTAGHGGFHVSAGLLRKMDPALRRVGGKYISWKAEGWFEEDCEWAAVVVSFPERFEPSMVAAAEKTMEQWQPEAWEAFQNTK